MKVPYKKVDDEIVLMFPEGLRAVEAFSGITVKLHEKYAEVRFVKFEPVAECKWCRSPLWETKTAIWDEDYEVWFCSQECNDKYFAIQATWCRVGPDGKPLPAEDDVWTPDIEMNQL